MKIYHYLLLSISSFRSQKVSGNEVLDFKTLGMRMNTLLKCLICINKIVNTRQQINMSLMSRHGF
jgi:hypothetical protein